MSFTEKHRYSLYEVRYSKNDFFEHFYMSQFPTNQEIFDALKQNRFIGQSSDIDEYKFERVSDKWYMPTIKIYSIEDYPLLIWEMRP